MPTNKLSTRLREAIRRGGISRYRIAADTGIAEATLSRYMAGKQELSLDAADKVASYFGLELKQTKGKVNRGKSEL